MNSIRQIFSRRRLYRELSEEMRQHLNEKADALEQEGLSRKEAEAAARRAFGNVRALEESGREPWQWPTIESFFFDVRYTLRQLRRQPSFTIVAILILGIGIGANTAVFSVIDTLLLEPLSFRAPERLIWIINRDSEGLSGRTSTVATYEALTKMRSFEEMTTYEAFFARSSYKFIGDADPDRVSGVMIPANFFPFLGVAPLIGRTFTDDECQASGPGAVVLGHSFWEQSYSSDPGVIGRQVVINDRAATIVGVMPPTFDFGSVFAPGLQIDIYMPAVFDVLREWGTTMAVIGRLRPGMTLGAAQTEAQEIIERQQQDRPEFGSGYGAILKPFHESVIGDAGRSILTLWTGVGLVLLIVCVNMSSLLLARAATRRKEIALRAAIGAGRGRLARQLLTESLVLSVLGGGLGIAFAYLAVDYVRRLEDLSIPLLKTVAIDGGALGIALGVTVLTALLFGLAPAIAAGRGNLDDALRGGGRGSSEGRDHRFVRSILVVSEVGLACVLLIGAGLMLRSFMHVLDVDLGFGTEGTYTLRVDAGENIDSAEKFSTYMRGIMSTASAVPGVVAASITDAVPLDSNRTWGVRAKQQPPDQFYGALVKFVGPGLMETMRTPIISGREFTEFDDEQSVPVVLINESLAEILWPGQDPLLKTLINSGKELQVVGVVGDVRHLSVEGASVPEFYLSVLQAETMSPSLVFRTDRPFADVAPGLRAALADLAPDLPTTTFQPLQQVVDRALSSRRFIVNLLAGFAIAAIALAAIGIYGVISYSVTRRTAEIGIRQALGASRSRIRASIVGHTMLLAVSGVAVGGVAAVAFSSLLASLLFGVSPRDPWSFVGSATILLLVAVAAGFIPAYRASRISPVTALRAE